MKYSSKIPSTNFKYLLKNLQNFNFLIFGKKEVRCGTVKIPYKCFDQILLIFFLDLKMIFSGEAIFKIFYSLKITLINKCYNKILIFKMAILYNVLIILF